MNPITSTVAASCNRLVLSPRTSPRSSPRPSPNVTRKSPFLDLPADEKKRRDSKEIEDYKKQLAATTRQAYKEKRTENEGSNNVVKGSNTAATKEKPAKRLLEEAVAVAATAEKREQGKKTTNSKPSKSSSSGATTKGKKCTIMWLSWYLIVLSRTSHAYSAWILSSAELKNSLFHCSELDLEEGWQSQNSSSVCYQNGEFYALWTCAVETQQEEVQLRILNSYESV